MNVDDVRVAASNLTSERHQPARPTETRCNDPDPGRSFTTDPQPLNVDATVPESVGQLIEVPIEPAHPKLRILETDQQDLHARTISDS
jgi:hypothetical protein